TLSFFNGATLLGTLTFDDPTVPGANRAFAGITSTTGVTSFRLTATNGENINTGVDNIYAALTGPSGVPEPASWATMLLGFAVVGFMLRARRQLLRATVVPHPCGHPAHDCPMARSMRLMR